MNPKTSWRAQIIVYSHIEQHYHLIAFMFMAPPTEKNVPDQLVGIRCLSDMFTNATKVPCRMQTRHTAVRGALTSKLPMSLNVQLFKPKQEA